MQKYIRYIFTFALILMVLSFWAAGCTSQTPQGEPESPGRQTKQGEQAQPKSAGDVEPNQNSQLRETKGQENTSSVSPGDQVPVLLSATVTKVVDGDTVHVTLSDGKEEKVRFIGVDTPESTKQVEPYGKEAATYTKSRLDRRKVWLELDVEKRDRYGRLLAYIWLEQPDSDVELEVRSKMYNAGLLLNGYAQVMTVPPNVKYADLFIKLQHEAREANKGLWGLTGEEKAVDAEDYYVASIKSNKYHRPGCEWGKKIAPANLIKFKTADEALDAGYEPCRSCNP